MEENKSHKVCFICKEQKPGDQFINRYKSGVVCEFNACKKCRYKFVKRNKEMKIFKKKNKIEFLELQIKELEDQVKETETPPLPFK